MTMFQSNTGTAEFSIASKALNRKKRFKKCATALAVSSLAIGQAAIAAVCPSGPVKSDLSPGSWDIVKIRDFGLWQGQPYSQMMLCLHRGFHDNYDDNGSPFGAITRGVPEHSERSIRNAFNYAPCVELDFQKRFLNKASRDAGASSVVLTHDAIADRIMSKYTAVIGSGVTQADLNAENCDTSTLTATDSEGNRTIECSPEDLYNAFTDTYRAPSRGVPFNASPVRIAQKTNFTATYGSIKSFYSDDRDGTTDQLLNQKWLMNYINDCRAGKKVGLVVADIKTYDSLVAFVEEMEAFMRPMSSVNKQNFARYWMVKTKPWKMRPSSDTSTDFSELSALIRRLKALDIPVIDTIAQQGTYSPSGSATAITGLDYDLAKAYYKRSNEENYGPSGRRAIELVVPGNSNYDPIRSGTLRIWTRSGCSIGYTYEGNLNNLRDAANVACNFESRTDPNKKPHLPQIWAWVPLEDGRAANVLNASGQSVISPSYSYVQYGGKYPFGLASSNVNPSGYRIGVDAEERTTMYAFLKLGARAITIDSLYKFQRQFYDVITDQTYFME